MKRKVTDSEQREILLKMIDFVDNICCKYNLEYSLIAGTMLGAIRHHGFIPWDDDLDIIMKRPDYEQLKKVLKEECKDTCYSVRFPEDIEGGYMRLPFAKLIDSRTYCKTVEASGKDFGVFIDIFPLDKVPKSEAINYRIECLKLKNRAVMSSYPSYTSSKNRIRQYVKTFLYFPQYLKHKNKGNIKDGILNLEKYMQQYNDTVDSDFYYLYGAEQYPNIFFEPHWVSGTGRLKFENLSLPVYNEYDKILQMYYGDYMTPPTPTPKHTHGYKYYWR